MKRRRDDRFATVRSEGGLLPGDLLGRIAAGDVPGTKAPDYHAGGRSLGEVTSDSWERLTIAWRSFSAARLEIAESDPGTGATRERWLLVLFDALGYGRLLPARAPEIEGRSYPLSHAWHKSPIHLLGWNVDLDHRSPGVAGAARMSPHGMVQELLNRSDEYLWGFVSNGRVLRVLRDNASFARQAYVEFDLEGMMEGEAYSDFRLLWLLCHQSRVEAPDPVDCWLERWIAEARQQGVRALEELREGVQSAIATLGRGFLSHPGNDRIRVALRGGDLSPRDYYRHLLRLTYRLIFLFVAEDRGGLLSPGADEEARTRYADFYSTARLREMADRIVGTRHSDLYRGLRVVMDALGAEESCDPLALSPLGSFLWASESIGLLAGADLANDRLLEALRQLAYTAKEGARLPVDYRLLGAEELGSVYESLLELEPDLDTAACSFDLKVKPGHERKLTGSYYTPESLVACLLDTALDPVLAEASRAPEPAKAILAMKVCDPACGSGHFLVAAAHRIAKRLAAVETGEEEPAPGAVRGALRRVVAHCVYGVDLNPMAVELCKVSLWMEALDPGKPLAFLEHRIRCGNSLLGATPALIEKGIPDDAFLPIEGDDKEIAKSLKKRNKEERKGQRQLFTAVAADPVVEYETLSERIGALDRMADDTLPAVREKEATYGRLAHSPEFTRAREEADAWCAAFVWPKRRSAPEAVTAEAFRRLRRGVEPLAQETKNRLRGLAEEYAFFHWYIEFPEVFRVAQGETAESQNAGWTGGFDVVLGNPPWDTLSPDAKEFFSAYDPEVRFQDPENQRKIIADLLGDGTIAGAWALHRRVLFSQVHFFKNSGRYRLFAPGNLGKGDFNVFRMFVEAAMQISSPFGRVAQVVPEGFYCGANSMAIRKELLDHFDLDYLLGFENAREVWFKGIDSRTKFALYSARQGGRTERFDAAFCIRTSRQLSSVRQGATLSIPVALVREFSPDALAVMEFRDQRDIDIAARMYARWPKFGDEHAGPPHRQYMREIDMGNDRELFSEDPGGLPLYEGRMVWLYDHRAKGYRSGRGRKAVWEELPFGRAGKSIQPQWHVLSASVPAKCVERVQGYRMGFCDVCSPTNERSLVAAIIPPWTIAGHSLPTFTFEEGSEWAYLPWLATANSFVMDFLVRFKVSLHMTFTVLDSMPFPRLSLDDPLVRQLAPLVLSLSCTCPRLTPYWCDMAGLGLVPEFDDRNGVPGLLDPAERQRVSAEIDATVAGRVFGLTRDEVEYVMESFPIVRKRDEKRHGEYLTRSLILEAFDHLGA